MSKKGRFATTRTVRLPLSEDDWIEVRERLSHGEQERMTTAGFRGVQEDKEMVFVVNGEELAIARLKAWLVDWSFRDDDDKPVKLSTDAIKALDPDTVAEIDAALDLHVEAIEAAKKVQSGRPRLVEQSA